MAQESKVYSPVEFLFHSKGLIARYAEDRAPKASYLDFRNCLERAEDSLSTRLGTSIINRDAPGASNLNYFFDSPVTSLAKLTYAGSPSRYAGLSDGSLWRRNSNAQGPYTQIYTGLSGNPFQSVVASCYETSQAYLFIYDGDASIKDSGTGTPQLTGIDPPAQTANTQPYSPLLTLIDNFAPANTYTSENFSVAWASTAVTTLKAATSQQITDFPEFLGITNTSGGTPSGPFNPSTGPFTTPDDAALIRSGTNIVTSDSFYGFPSTVLNLLDVVTLSVVTVSYNGSVSLGTWSSLSGTVQYEYSLDNGVSWTPFYTYSQTLSGWSPTVSSEIPITVTAAISGLTNLNTVRLGFVATITGSNDGSFSPVYITGQINAITATIDNNAASDPFDGVQDGMLAVLGTTDPTPVTIASVASATLIGGVYTQLLVTTQTAHGLAANSLCSVYGTNNDLVDGFYVVQSAPNATTYLVNFYSVVYLSATGGFSYGGQPAPSTCVVANHQGTPYPSQFSGWGFYEQVPLAQISFPVWAWSGTVAQNTTTSAPATVGNTINLDLSINNQVTDDDLIVLTLLVSDPAAIDNIRLQFDVRGSGYSSSYYYKDISPAYYQQGVSGVQNAYASTEQQILADSVGLLSGATPGSITAQLQPGTFSTGESSWQTVYLRRGDFVAVGTAGKPGLDWSAITGWQLVITTNTVGSSTVACNGLYLQWGYGPSSFGGVGYDYRYIYYDANTGTPSNGSPEQQFNLLYGWLSSLSAPIYLRQASQTTGLYSSDPQVTHVRIYRRGGTYNDNWRQIDQIPNITGGGVFYYKDVIADSVIAQAQTLVLDNDPPVTSSLRTPIQTTLLNAPSSPGTGVYSTFAPQTMQVAQSAAVFVPNQIVDVGNANNLEQVAVTTGGIGQFTATLRLQHNAGEPVNVYAVPRQPCNLCALAYDQVWLAGDKNNPHYLYYSKKNQPENFGPEDYIPVGSPDFPIVIVVNWRGTLFVATTQTWWLIVGGAQPYPQPTGSIHGAVASEGWTQDEGGVGFRSADGWRRFGGADGAYVTLPVEFLFKQTPLTPVPLTDPTQIANDVFAYFNNVTFGSYVSLDSGKRYRLAFDHNYSRFRYDDVAATAMLWERDTNMLLAGVPAPAAFPNKYAIVQDQVPNQDYDDGGWASGALVQTPIELINQIPYQDLGAPHFPKQWNTVEVDANTYGQTLTVVLNFDDGIAPLTLGTITTAERQKIQLKVNGGDGQESYKCSPSLTGDVTVAPFIYQLNIYADVLAANRTSYDTYWQKFGTADDVSKVAKQVYIDYTSTAPVTMAFYSDGNPVPYYIPPFTLPASPTRSVIRVRLTALKFRTWRMILLSDSPMQIWAAPRVEQKPVQNSSWQVAEVAT
jgi:hypothetical protein